VVLILKVRSMESLESLLNF